jgi:hypothetical protein
MKQYSILKYYKGIEFHATGCFESKKDACAILEVNMHRLVNYGLVFEPQNKECIEKPNTAFAYFDKGELCHSYPEKKHKLMNMADIILLIDNRRNIKHTII